MAEASPSTSHVPTLTLPGHITAASGSMPAPVPKASEAVAAQATPAVEEAPDPDEDDLDDLDDLLDEFSSAKIDQKPDAPTSSGPGRPDPFPTGKADDDLAEEFNKQLQAQMASLMGEIDESPEMRRQLAEMMNELTTDAGAQLEADDKVGGGSKGVAGAPANPDEAFQDTIRKTMERMQASGDRATAAAADESEDMLATMLKELQGEGGGSEEDISKMLLGMMEQLTNKDILYEPMKELNDKFPAWMEKNKATTAADDLARYVEQQHLVGEIVGRFERKQYSDDNAADREFIVERMQKMQAAGSPPADLVGDMKDAQEALGDIDPGCSQQ